jgi:hypothetical protein
MTKSNRDNWIELAEAFLYRDYFSMKRYNDDEDSARRDHAARELGLTRGEYERLRAEQDRYVASARALEDRLIVGLEWLGFTVWSESEEARRSRLDDPQRYEKIESLWISVLHQYEWSLRELEIRGIPYESRSLEAVAEPHPLFEILEQDFYLTGVADDAILRIGIFAS